MSASMRFLTKSLLSAGFLLFSCPSRIANVLYLPKSAPSSNSTVIFCPNAHSAAHNVKISSLINRDFSTHDKSAGTAEGAGNGVPHRRKVASILLRLSFAGFGQGYVAG